MATSYRDILRDLSRPLEPEPTGEPAVLRRLEGIRAVLFDVYGTLFVSGSGEVGTAQDALCRHALAGALRSVGVPLCGPAEQGVKHLFQAIEDSHAQSRRRGIEHPEVDLVQIWRDVVRRLSDTGGVDGPDWTDDQLKRLAVEYEGRANPVWPMPGLRECLAGLRAKGIVLGIVSNAQFYTPLLFEALLGGTPEQLGFDPAVQYYSYRHGRAKPALALHAAAAGVLCRRGIEPAAGLYVGNDMLNDVYPAGRVGFRTALFAGDARSLRRRPGDPRLEGITPDLVLTSLAELNACV